MKTGFVYNFDIGSIRIVESDKGISEVSFSDAISDLVLKETPLIKKTYTQLQEYFKGERKTFTIPLDIQGTSFQEKTWQALLTIPYGETWSYKDLAIAIGNGNASRAVGNANNKNRIGILIPCHRVIGSTGKLVGYAAGLTKKEYLLSLEKQYK